MKSGSLLPVPVPAGFSEGFPSYKRAGLEIHRGEGLKTKDPWIRGEEKFLDRGRSNIPR